MAQSSQPPTWYERTRRLELWKIKRALGEKVLGEAIAQVTWVSPIERSLDPGAQISPRRGGREFSPISKLCDSDESQTQEHTYWKRKKWAEVREKFPLARKVYEETRFAVTKACPVLRSEDDLHSQAKVVRMQWMMVLKHKRRLNLVCCLFLPC